MDSCFPGQPRHAAFEVAGDLRPEDARELARLLDQGFNTLTLVSQRRGPTIENLYELFHHPALAKETSWQAALDRIFRTASSSDVVFVGPSERAGWDQANALCQQRNMVRLS